jgi:hypothetical protein
LLFVLLRISRDLLLEAADEYHSWRRIGIGLLMDAASQPLRLSQHYGCGEMIFPASSRKFPVKLLREIAASRRGFMRVCEGQKCSGNRLFDGNSL